MKVITIGRNPDNDVVVNDTYVSGNHIQLILKDNGNILLVDLGSSNGTYVNGNKIEEKKLEHNDIVKIGNTVLPWRNYLELNPKIEEESDFETEKTQIESPVSPPPVSDKTEIKTGVFSGGKYPSLSRNWLIISGILLVLFVLLPIMDRDKWVFVNFELFSGKAEYKDTPGVFKLMFILPLFLGIGAFILSAQKRKIGTNILILLAGLIPLLILYTDKEFELLTAFSIIEEADGRSILGMLSFLGLFSGSLALINNPSNRTAGIIAAVGGICFIIQMLIPTEAINGKDKIEIVQAIDLISGKGEIQKDFATGVGLIMLASIILSLLASIFSFQLFGNAENPDKVAKSVFNLNIWSYIPIVFALVFLFKSFAKEAETAAIVIFMAKFLALIFGLAILVGIGFAELLNPVEEDKSED